MNAGRVDVNVANESENMAANMQAVSNIEDRMPYLVSLSKEEGQGLPALGAERRGFVVTAINGAEQNPGFLPPTVDLQATKRDLELYDFLLPLQAALHQLVAKVDDTVHAAGGEAYADARLIYHFAKAAPAELGLGELVKELAKLFARRSSSSSEGE